MIVIDSNRINMKFIFSILVFSTIFLYLFDSSLASMNLKQLLPIDSEVMELEKNTRSKLSKLVCSDCHDSNLQLTADETTSEKVNSPSLFNVFINMAVHKVNQNNSDLVPITHQGPRRVLLERIDEQTRQINDCNKMVKDLSDLSSRLKKSYDECEIESYSNLVKREESCAKQIEEIRYKFSQEATDCNTASEKISFWMNESKTCSKSSQYVLMDLEQCKVNTSRLNYSYEAFKTEVAKKANATDSMLSSCKSQGAACQSSMKNLSSTITHIGYNYATCNASLSRTEAKILESIQQNTELNSQLSGLQQVVQDKNRDLVAITSRSFDLENALSMLQEELQQQLGGGNEVDQIASISKSSLFLYSMLLLLLGYFIREFKVVFRVSRDKKVVTIKEDRDVVEGHIISANSIVKSETDDASCSLNSSGSAFVEMEFQATDEFDGSELIKENTVLKEKLDQCAQEKVLIIKLNQQLRRLVGSTSEDTELTDMEDNVRQLTDDWGQYTSSLQEKESEFEDLQKQLAERDAALLESEAAEGSYQLQVAHQTSLLLQLEKDLKDMQVSNSSQLLNLSQRDQHINDLQQRLESADSRSRSLRDELDAAMARIEVLENELISQHELADNVRTANKLASDKQIQELYAQLDSANAEIETLKSTAVEVLNRTVSDLRVELDEVSSSRDDAYNRCTFLNEQLVVAFAKVSSLEGEVENLRDEKMKYAAVLEDLNRTVRDLRVDLDDVSAKKDEAAQRCTLLSQQLDEALAKVSNLEGEVENLRDAKTKDAAVIEALNKTVKELKADLDDVSAKKDEADQRCTLLSQQLGETLAKVSNLEGEVEYLRDERSKDAAVIEALNKTVNDLKVDLDKVFAQKDEAEKLLVQQLNDALSKVSDYESEITQLRDQKAKDESVIEDLNKAVQELKVDLDKVFMSKDDGEKILLQQLSETRSKVSIQEEELDKLRDEKTKDVTLLAELHRSLRDVKAEVSNQELAIENLRSEKSGDSALMQSLNRQIENLKEDLNQISSGRDDAERRCASLTQKLSEATSKAILNEECLNQQLEESQVAISNFTAESHSVKQQLTSELESIKSMQTKSDNDLKLSRERVSDLEENLDSLEKELRLLRDSSTAEKLESENAKVILLTDFAAKEAALQQKLAEALATIEDNVRALKQQHEDTQLLQNDLVSMTTKAAEMALSTKNYEAVIQELQQKVATADATIKELDKAKASLSQSLLERERTLSFLQSEYQTCRVNITEVCENALNLNARSEALVKVLRSSFEEHRELLKIHDEEKGPRLSYSDSDTGDEVFSANNPMYVISTDSQDTQDGSLSTTDDALRHSSADVPNQVMLALEKIRSIPNQLTSIEFHTTLLQRFLDSHVAAQQEQANNSNEDEVSDLKRQIEEAALFIKQENSILTEMLRYRGALATRVGDSG